MSRFKAIGYTAMITGALFFTPYSTTQAQVIASLDSGANPIPPLEGNLLTGGFNFVSDNPNTSDDSIRAHGTTVALIIESINPNAEILPIKISDSELQGTTAAANAGLAFAAARSDVRIILKTTLGTASLAAMQNAANSGKMIIVPAGNDAQGAPRRDATNIPQLGGRGIIVGGVDGSNTIHPISNQAGPFADHFLVANAFNQFSTTQGTSFAAPHVAAAASLVLQKDPQLSAEQVVEILFRTADDLGETGIDPIYGHGKVNANRALQPVGETGSGGSGGSSSSTGIAALAVGGAVAYALLRRNNKLKRTLVLDEYGRSYSMDFTTRPPVRDSRGTISSVLNALDKHQAHVETLVNTDERYLFAIVSDPGTSAYFIDSQGNMTLLDENEFNDSVQPSLSLRGGNADGWRYRFDLNADAKSGYGSIATLAETAAPTPLFITNDSFSTPFLGFTQSGISTQTAYHLDNNIALKLGFSAADDQERFGRESDSALFEGTYYGKRGAISVQFGHLAEHGSLFGGASDGVFSVDESNTLSLGLSGSWRLNNKLAVIGNYAEGYTSVDQRDESFLNNFSDLRSNTWGLGLVAGSIFKDADQMGFAVSRPLRVSSGLVDMTVPESRDIEGNIFSNTDRISLEPVGSELTFEAYYQRPISLFGTIGKDAKLISHIMYRDQPQHDNQADGEISVLTALQFDF